MSGTKSSPHSATRSASAQPLPQRVSALGARDKVLTAIKHDLTVNGIELPFPTLPKGADA